MTVACVPSENIAGHKLVKVARRLIPEAMASHDSQLGLAPA